MFIFFKINDKNVIFYIFLVSLLCRKLWNGAQLACMSDRQHTFHYKFWTLLHSHLISCTASSHFSMKSNWRKWLQVLLVFYSGKGCCSRSQSKHLSSLWCGVSTHDLCGVPPRPWRCWSSCSRWTGGPAAETSGPPTGCTLSHNPSEQDRVSQLITTAS